MRFTPPQHEHVLFLKAPNGSDAGHGGGDVMDHWLLHLVVQLLGLVDTAVHDHIEKDDQSQDDDKGESEVWIQEAYDGNLKI